MLIRWGAPEVTPTDLDEPFVARVVRTFEDGLHPFELVTDPAGLDLAPLERGKPGRCRLKLFRPREGKERLCAFFYKRSNLPWSRDRFSYGGVEFVPSHVTQAEVQRWIGWLASGLDPEKKPERLRRSFLYDIPD